MPESSQAQTSPVNLIASGQATPNNVLVGDQFAWSVTITNAGTNTASNVTVLEQLPSGFGFVSAYSSQGSNSAGSGLVEFYLGDMAGGSSSTLLVYLTAGSPGTFENTVSLSADQPLVNPANGVIFIPVTVNSPNAPVITKQPLSQLLNLGGLLNLVVEAIALPDVHYQWRLNGANIPGATNASYTVLGLLAPNCGNYTVVVADGNGVTTSSTAFISLAGLLALPASDNFESRGPLGILGTGVGSNVGATGEPGEPVHGGIPGGKSVWFTWKPLLSGNVTFSTAGSSFDTVLAVYTGDALTNLVPVASDDDYGGYYTSEVKFYAVAGTSYQIAIDGAYGAEGNIILTSSQALLGKAVPSISSQPQDQIVAFGATAQFSVTAGGTALGYQWYLNDVAVSGATASSLVISNVSTNQLGRYAVKISSGGQSLLSEPATLQVSTTDGAVNPNRMAEDKFQALARAKGGFSSRTATARSGPVKRDTTTSRGYSSTQVFNTYGDQTQSGEPNNCNNPGGSSAWTSVTAADNGVITINTYGSSFTTVLGAFTGNGSDFSSLTNVACSVGAGTGGTSNSLITFSASSNVTYYISVDGVNGTYGKVVLNSTLTVPPSITSQSGSQTAQPGATVTLSAGATGYAPPGCQWLFNGTPLAGCTNGTLIITNFQAAKAGVYSMVATNSLGSQATTPISLVMNSAVHLDSFAMNPTNNAFQMRVVGFANSNYVIQASTDMLNWIAVATNNSPTGMWNFSDPQSAVYAKRFYRVAPGQ